MKEVVIVGGGIVGLWSAWHLQKADVQVTIVDKGNLEDGCSHGNAGMIVPSHFIPMASPGVITKGIQWMFKKDSPFYIRPRLNLDLAQWLWQFYRSSTIKHVSDSMSLLSDLHFESKTLYKDLNASPEFNFGFEEKGILMLFQTPHAEKEELEVAHAAHRLGMEANHYSADHLSKIETGTKLSVTGAIHYPGDAHLEPHKFMIQMVQYLKKVGVEFYTVHDVVDIVDHGKAGATIQLADGNSMEAKQVVITAGVWSGKLMRKSGYRMPMQDGKGYSMIIPNPDIKPTIPAILHEARVAITPMGDDLRISGTLEISGMDDHINAHKVKSILDAVPRYYPELSIARPQNIWFGYRPCTPDGLPYLGKWHDGSAIVAATGHAMMGLSLAPASGRIVCDMITKKPNALPHPKLSPSRF